LTDSLEAGLERFLRARLPGASGVKILSLERSTEGFSQETFSFEVEIDRDGVASRRAFVAKRAPQAGLLEPYDLEPEFRVLNALSDDPLPSPATPWFERDPAVLERPFYVMERLPGKVPIPAQQPDGSGPLDPATRATLTPEVVAALVRLHAIDWRARGLSFLGPPEPGTGAALRELKRWQTRIEAAQLFVPAVMQEALGWLHRHAPATDETTLVHGDFRLGNWLVDRSAGAARLSGILDWEMVHLGDPLEDIAWCSSLLWRAGTPLASGLAPPAEFYALYAKASGREVDPERLRFYELLSLVKMSAIMLTGIRAFRDGRTADLRMAVFDYQLAFLMAGIAVLRGWLPAPNEAEVRRADPP
jgi:aminoglycoside phosphotransferase (APT) family kinase protein